MFEFGSKVDFLNTYSTVRYFKAVENINHGIAQYFQITFETSRLNPTFFVSAEGCIIHHIFQELTTSKQCFTHYLFSFSHKGYLIRSSFNHVTPIDASGSCS
jgi:hypothetical protein